MTPKKHVQVHDDDDTGWLTHTDSQLQTPLEGNEIELLHSAHDDDAHFDADEPVNANQPLTPVQRRDVAHDDDSESDSSVLANIVLATHRLTQLNVAGNVADITAQHRDVDIAVAQQPVQAVDVTSQRR